MFEAAVHDFVKQAGEDCLHEVPSLYESDEFKPFQIVIMKNRRFFWQTPKYETQDFTLNEILIGQEKLSNVSISKNIFMKNYQKKSKLSLSGKFGAKIKSIFEVDLEGLDHVDVESHFGDVEKEQVDAQQLLDALKSRKMNMSHSLVSQVKSHKRKVICIVSGIARTTQDCVISLDIEKSGKENMDVRLKAVNIDESGSVDSKKDKSFTVKAQTPLAFEIYELKVGNDGSIEVMVDPDSHGGFSSTDTTDGPIVSDLTLYRTFNAIIDLPPDKREKLTSDVLHVCKTPVVSDNFAPLLKQAFTSIRNGERKYSNIDTIQKNLYATDTKWTGLLEFAGFNIKSDGSVVYPLVLSDALSCLRSVFDALHELEDESVASLSKCTANIAKPLLYLFQQGLVEKPLKLKDSKISALYEEANAGQELAHDVGFTIESHDTVCPPVNKRQLNGVYRAVYALWGTKEDSD